MQSKKKRRTRETACVGLCSLQSFRVSLQFFSFFPSFLSSISCLLFFNVSPVGTNVAARKHSAGCSLKAYQVEGVLWLQNVYQNGMNGILADEMGLGKTVVCIAFLASLWEDGTKGPFLVLAPLSTLGSWLSELKKYCLCNKRCSSDVLPLSIPFLMFHMFVHSFCNIQLFVNWFGIRITRSFCC